MKGRKLNKKKLSVLLAVPIFIGLAIASGVLGAAEEIPDQWNKARWEHAERAYAASKGTTVKALRDAEFVNWKAVKQNCISNAREVAQARGLLSVFNNDDELFQLMCGFQKAVLAIPKDSLVSYMQGLTGTLPFMATIGVLLLLSLGVALSLVYVLPVLIFVAVPVQSRRLWRWLHK